MRGELVDEQGGDVGEFPPLAEERDDPPLKVLPVVGAGRLPGRVTLEPVAGVLSERETARRVRLAALPAPLERPGVLQCAGCLFALPAAAVAVDDDVAGAAVAFALEDARVAVVSSFAPAISARPPRRDRGGGQD